MKTLRTVLRALSTARPAAVLAGAAIALAAAPPTPLQSDRLIRDELKFARGLATDWQFVELAERVLDQVDLDRASDSAKEEVGLTRCEVFASGARRERDPERKRQLYRRALQSYNSYLDENRFAENRGQAERELVGLAMSFGTDMYERYVEAIGEEAEDLRQEIADVLTDAIGRTADLTDKIDAEIDEQAATEGSTVDLEREKYNLMLNRGQMLLTRAQVADDGTYFFAQALDTLEKVGDEAGELSVYGLQAFLMMGRVYMERGEYTDATDFVGYVVESAVPSDPDARAADGGFDSLGLDAQENNWRFVDLATEPLIQAYLGAGNIDMACHYALHFQNCIDHYGVSVSRPAGYLSMLAAGRALMDSGGFVGGTPGEYQWFQTREEMLDAGFKSRRNSRPAIDLALQMAQRVNKDNRGNTLQLRAQNLISEIIDRGVSVDPEILFEAAQGSYYEEHYAEAIEGFKRVLSVLEAGDDATRTRLGPEVLWHIGRSFQKSGRQLEAAMAFRAGLEERWRGDPKYDVENAKGFHTSISAIHKRAVVDDRLEAMFREAQDLVVEITADTESAGGILYSQAKLAYDQDNYEEARTRFLEVPSSADNYEKARAYAAVCLRKMGQPKEALTEIEDYLQNYVNDPIHVPTTPSAIRKRSDAMGLATYYGGLIHFAAAEAGEDTYETVLEWLDDFADKFPEQESFAPKTIFIALNCYLKLGDRKQAEARRDRLVREFEDSAFTGLGAFEIYKVNRDLREKAEERGDEEAIPELTRAMANNLALYNDKAGEARLNNLRIEGGLWGEIGEWAKVKEVLQEAVDRFEKSSDPEDTKAIRNFVLPDLAHALLELHEVRDAADILTPLMANEEYTPSPETARDFCRSVAGWVEGTEREIIEVPGIGDEASFARATEILVKLENQTDSWTCYWYGLKFEVVYAYYQWGQIDGKQLQSARGVLDQMKADMSPGFREINDSCGDDVLRQRYLWIAKKL